MVLVVVAVGGSHVFLLPPYGPPAAAGGRDFRPALQVVLPWVCRAAGGQGYNVLRPYGLAYTSPDQGAIEGLPHRMSL